MIRAHLQMAVHQSAIVVISIASILAPARWLGTAHDRTDTDTDLAPSLWPGLSKGRILQGVRRESSLTYKGESKRDALSILLRCGELAKQCWQIATLAAQNVSCRRL